MSDTLLRRRPVADMDAGETMAIESALDSLAADWRDDPALRARAASEPREVLAERGIDIPTDSDMRIVANTDEVYRLVMPPDPNVNLADSELSRVSGGANCLGSVATASTVGTVPSTVSSSGTASSASTGPRPGGSS